MKFLRISQPIFRYLLLILLIASPVVIAAGGLEPFLLSARIDDRALSALSWPHLPMMASAIQAPLF